jgi:hypothetical protein
MSGPLFQLIRSETISFDKCTTGINIDFTSGIADKGCQAYNGFGKEFYIIFGSNYDDNIIGNE